MRGRLLAVMLMTVAVALAGTDERVPEWTLPMPGGEQVEFRPDRLERPALLLFWATWCPYCRALMPEIQALQDQYGGDSLDIYAINIWEDGDPVRHMADRGFTYTLLLSGDAVAEEYGVKGTPGLFLVGADGRIDYVRRSGAEPQAVRLAIEEMLTRGE